MVKAFIDKYLVMILGIVAGVAIIAAIVFFWLWLGARDRVAALEVKLDNQVAETQEAVDANTTNLVTIETLRTANQRLVDERRADATRTQAELEKRGDALMRSQQEASRLRRERDAIIHNNAACRVHGQTVLADSCPDLANRLRERSRVASRDGNDDG